MNLNEDSIILEYSYKAVFMSDNYISLVPKTTNYPNRQQKAREILNWFISADYIKAEPSDCILGSDLGYSVANGARHIVKFPEDLPFDLWTNGLELVTEHQVFDPGELYEEDKELPESNLGFTFWNWPDFTPEFLTEFSKRLDMEIHVVFGRI